MNDMSIMPFGKHKGKHLKDVPANYLIWLHDEGKLFGSLKYYVKRNMYVLKKESNQ